MLSDLLRRYPLFAVLKLRHLESWLATAQELPFEAGETILQEGTPGTWAYLIREGRVRVWRQSRKQPGQERTLGTLVAGELFGEYALLSPGMNKASCRAAVPCRLLRLPLATLQTVLLTYPRIGVNLKNWLRLHMLVHHLRGRSFLGFMAGPSSLKLLDHLQSVTVGQLQTLQTTGLSADRWFFIESGQVSLHAPENEPPVPSRDLGPGDFFGEQAFLDGNLPLAVALEETRCLALPRAIFEPTLEKPSFQTIGSNVAISELLWVGQRDEADCGVAALAMMARVHGKELDVAQLRQQLPVSEKGLSLMDLQRAAVDLSFRSQAIRIQPNYLDQVAWPAIALMKGGHYVVVFEVNPLEVVVGDPATGLVRLGFDRFAQTFSGKLLLVQRA